MAPWKTSGKFRMKIKQQKKHGFASRVMKKAGPIIRPDDLWLNNSRTSRPTTAPSRQPKYDQSIRHDRSSRYYGRYVVRGVPKKRPARDPTSSFYQRRDPSQKRPTARSDPTSSTVHNDQHDGLKHTSFNSSFDPPSTGAIKSLNGVRRELTYSPRFHSRAPLMSTRHPNPPRQYIPEIARRRLRSLFQDQRGTDPRKFGSFTTRPSTQTFDKPFIQPTAAHGSSSNQFLPSGRRHSSRREYNYQSSGHMPYSEYDTSIHLESQQQQQPPEWQHPHHHECYPSAKTHRSVLPTSCLNGMYDSSGPPPSFREQQQKHHQQQHHHHQHQYQHQQQSLSPHAYFPTGINNLARFPSSDQDPAYYPDFADLPLSTSPQQKQQHQEKFLPNNYGLANHPHDDVDGSKGLFGSQYGHGRQFHDEQEMFLPEENLGANNDLYEGYTFFDPEPEENMYGNFESQESHHHQGDYKVLSPPATGFAAARDNTENNHFGDNLDLGQDSFENLFEANFDQVGTDHNINSKFNRNHLEDDLGGLKNASWTLKESENAPPDSLMKDDLGSGMGVGAEDLENGISFEPLFGKNQSQQNETGFGDFLVGNKAYPDDMRETGSKPPNSYDHFNDNYVYPKDSSSHDTTKPFDKKMSQITIKPDIEDQISSLTPTSLY